MTIGEQNVINALYSPNAYVAPIPTSARVDMMVSLSADTVTAIGEYLDNHRHVDWDGLIERAILVYLKGC
jgi:hypothetical protein